MADSDDDVPPLEDMSEILDQVKALQLQKSPPGPAPSVSAPVSRTSPMETSRSVSASAPVSTSPVASATTQVSTTTDQKQTKTESSSGSGFGGMKKGFLFGGNLEKAASKRPPKVSSRASAATCDASGDDIPLIKPKDPDGESRFSMPEVQEAMKASQQLMNNKDWVTEDLLTKVSSNKNLLKNLSDPRFMEALAEFQTNPQAALTKYADNKEIQSFLKDFCSILGDHFSNMDDTQNSSPGDAPVQTSTAGADISSGAAVQTRLSGADISVHSSTDPKQATAADELQMQEILADPAVREVLMDPQIQKLMGLLRTDPQNAQRILRSSGPDVRLKIQKLCDVGLLQLQS